MPAMLAKLEALGVEKGVVGLVLPAGYTFNADGTCLYLTGAAIFIAQATNTPMTLPAQIELLAILLLTSKGSAGVAGAGFVTLAATLPVDAASIVAPATVTRAADRRSTPRVIPCGAADDALFSIEIRAPSRTTMDCAASTDTVPSWPEAASSAKAVIEERRTAAPSTLAPSTSTFAASMRMTPASPEPACVVMKPPPRS